MYCPSPFPLSSEFSRPDLLDISFADIEFEFKEEPKKKESPFKPRTVQRGNACHTERRFCRVTMLVVGIMRDRVGMM